MTQTKKRVMIAVISLAIVVAVAISQLTLFVVPPMGIIPEGQTLVITRLTNSKFIDSADAVCERTSGGVSLLCRAGVLGAVANNAQVLVRLPYSESLYRLSTNGATY